MRVRDNVSPFTDTTVVWLTASVSALPESDHVTPAGAQAVLSGFRVTCPEKTTSGSGTAALAVAAAKDASWNNLRLISR
jgi:hypothetical protein